MSDPLKPSLCARYLKAMADPDRLRIVQRLRNGPLSVGEIAGALDAPLANTSHRLKALREMGLVAATRRGRFCDLQPYLPLHSQPRQIIARRARLRLLPPRTAPLSCFLPNIAPL